MSDKFNALCKELSIDASSPKQEGLDALTHWYGTQVSTDNRAEGNFQQRFDFYKAMITDFLENIKPEVNSSDLRAPVIAFQGSSSLEHIVSKGLDVYLQRLNPTDAQIKAKNTCTLLQLAAFQGNLHTTQALLVLGLDPLEKGANGEPLLFTTLMLATGHDKAMMKKKQAIFEWLVKSFPTLLEQKNKANDTVLHIMAVYGYSHLMKETLSHSEHFVFKTNNLSQYPIHTAILNGQHACFEQLIAIKGVALLQDSEGRNALHYAASMGNTEMVRGCVDALPKEMVNEIVDARDEQEQTPLMKAIIANNSNTITIIQALLNAGAAINLQDAGMKTALHYAVESRNVSVVQLLLEKSEIEVNLIDENLKTPLDLIQDNTTQDEQIIELLSEKNAVHHKGVRPR